MNNTNKELTMTTTTNEHHMACECRACCPAPGDTCEDCGEQIRVVYYDAGDAENGPKLEADLGCGCSDHHETHCDDNGEWGHYTMCLNCGEVLLADGQHGPVEPHLVGDCA